MMTRIAAIGVMAASLVFAQAGNKKAPSADDTIFDQVRLRLASDPDVKGGAFQVDVKDGVVTLRGKVEKEKYKQKAEKLTKKVKGVKSVVNQLVVDQRTS
jgi:osmotically-inducible protein OsmY